MQYLWKILYLILFLVISLNTKLIAKNDYKNAKLVILDKTSSTKYSLMIEGVSNFRSLNFEILSCKKYNFEKYSDKIALIKIDNNNEIFIGWFFSKTQELNTYSDKIYEISLIDCNN